MRIKKKKSLSLNICHVKSVESSLGYPVYSRHADLGGRIPEPGHLWGQRVVLLWPPAGKVTASQSALRCLALLTRGLCVGQGIRSPLQLFISMEHVCISTGEVGEKLKFSTMSVTQKSPESAPSGGGCSPFCCCGRLLPAGREARWESPAGPRSVCFPSGARLSETEIALRALHASGTSC